MELPQIKDPRLEDLSCELFNYVLEIGVSEDPEKVKNVCDMHVQESYSLGVLDSADLIVKIRALERQVLDLEREVHESRIVSGV